MRRVLVVLACGAVAAATTIGASDPSTGTRVDAVFDSTANLIPGQDVKIAGARVGQVQDIALTKDRKARVAMEVDEGYAPFRADAECTIRPQSLIGEKFVQCDPGTPGAGPLADGEDGAATVPVDQTHSPVDLDLVFAALRKPYSQRLAIILNELGTGLAGRPEDLNATIRRANPALQEANDVLRILDRDRAALGRLVEQSDRVIAELAQRREHVTSFIERSDRVARTVAGRRDELGQVIERLPPLLDELEPTADRLASLAADAAPTLRDLRGAAPLAKALLEDFDPVADAARPALVRLAATSKVARRAVRAARPVADRLRPVAAILPPIVELGADLNESLRDSGTVEHLLLYMFYGAGAQARFDQFSHILPSYQLASDCQQYARTPLEGCSAHFGDQPAAATQARRTSRPHRGATLSAQRRLTRSSTRSRREPSRKERSPTQPPALPAELREGGSPADIVTQALDFLLGP
jgi:phospholipid/cholesterol/gamma-HCH transport system substrate-binding protein